MGHQEGIPGFPGFAQLCLTCLLVRRSRVYNGSEECTMPQQGSDINLLFGVLALQADFIGRDQ